MSQQTITFFECSHVGVSGTTPVAVRQNDDGTFEARVGIAILGYTNMDEAGFKAAENNPFHDLFHDNYSAGRGSTEEEALAALKADMQETSESLWF